MTCWGKGTGAGCAIGTATCLEVCGTLDMASDIGFERGIVWYRELCVRAGADCGVAGVAGLLEASAEFDFMLDALTGTGFAME